MFSNESNFQVFKMRSTTVWRLRLSDRFDPRYTVLTVKHTGAARNKKRGGLNFFAMVKAYANRKVLGKL